MEHFPKKQLENNEVSDQTLRNRSRRKISKINKKLSNLPRKEHHHGVRQQEYLHEAISDHAKELETTKLSELDKVQYFTNDSHEGLYSLENARNDFTSEDYEYLRAQILVDGTEEDKQLIQQLYQEFTKKKLAEVPKKTNKPQGKTKVTNPHHSQKKNKPAVTTITSKRETAPQNKQVNPADVLVGVDVSQNIN